MALTVLVGFSACFAASEGIRATQSKSRKEEHRSRKNNLIVHCTRSSMYSSALEGRQIVLSGEKLYVDTGMDPDGTFGHPFQGYYLGYPDAKYAGLVTTISDEVPLLNWVYVDRNTHEVKFGGRASSEGNVTGPYDCTRQDRRLTLGGWEGFVAVKEGDFWALYYDIDDDRLRRLKTKGVVPEDAPVLELELFRKEMRTRKPPPPPPPSAALPAKAQDGSAEGKGSAEAGESPTQDSTTSDNSQEGGGPGSTTPAISERSGFSVATTIDNMELPESPDVD